MQKRNRTNLIVIVVFAALVVGAAIYYRALMGPKTNKGGSGLSGDLILYHAGSLSVPFRDLARAFQKKHPGVTIRQEAAGSRQIWGF